MMERTICELYSSCGDPAGRIKGCTFESMPREIHAAFAEALWGVLVKILPIVCIVAIPVALHLVWNWVVFVQ